MARWERAIRCLLALQRGVRIDPHWMVREFGISLPQAKRDYVELERVLPVQRIPNGRGTVLVLP